MDTCDAGWCRGINAVAVHIAHCRLCPLSHWRKRVGASNDASDAVASSLERLQLFSQPMGVTHCKPSFTGITRFWAVQRNM